VSGVLTSVLGDKLFTIYWHAIRVPLGRNGLEVAPRCGQRNTNIHSPCTEHCIRHEVTKVTHWLHAKSIKYTER